MSDRDCENCKHHTKKGCDSWDCKFERRMTREEAIEHAKEQLEIFGGEHREFIELAIKALEQEPIDKSAMMYEIYMSGVNMSGEYQGCWVRFKDIKKIVDEYMAESEGEHG